MGREERGGEKTMGKEKEKKKNSLKKIKVKKTWENWDFFFCSKKKIYRVCLIRGKRKYVIGWNDKDALTIFK